MVNDNEEALVDAARQWIASNDNNRKPTINDVAKLSGVSKKTVSRVINQSASVKESTRKSVQIIIDAIDFQPDQQARGLAFRHSFLIGAIYDNPNAQYVVNMQQGILNGLKGTDYELVVHPCDRSQADFIEDAKQFVEKQKLRGVILTPSVSEDQRMADMLRQIGCDYIRIASVKLDDDQHMLVSNDRQGGKLAARHLCELGHKRIAFVTGKKGFRSSEERKKGFEEGLSEFSLQLEEKYIAQGEYTFESGIAAGHQLIALNPAPTAIFAANDEMAAGIMQAMRIKKFRVPEDISIVGFDDFQIALNVWPRLTTIHSPTGKIGQLAAKYLLSTRDRPAPSPVPWLVERESSAPPLAD